MEYKFDVRQWHNELVRRGRRVPPIAFDVLNLLHLQDADERASRAAQFVTNCKIGLLSARASSHVRARK
jgi:hypothetical protein